LAWADENRGETQSWPDRVDVVTKARELLRANHPWCKHLVFGVPDGNSK